MRSYRPGHTTAAGLGWAHQQARERALRSLRDGDLCARCEARGLEHPMFRDLISRGANGRLVAPLLDLDDFPGRAAGGPQVKRLSYAACNRAQGTEITNALRRRAAGKPPVTAYSRW